MNRTPASDPRHRLKRQARESMIVCVIYLSLSLIFSLLVLVLMLMLFSTEFLRYVTRRGPKSNTSLEREGEDEGEGDRQEDEEENKPSSSALVKQALDRVFTGVENERNGRLGAVSVNQTRLDGRALFRMNRIESS